MSIERPRRPTNSTQQALFQSWDQVCPFLNETYSKALEPVKNFLLTRTVLLGLPSASLLLPPGFHLKQAFINWLIHSSQIVDDVTDNSTIHLRSSIQTMRYERELKNTNVIKKKGKKNSNAFK